MAKLIGTAGADTIQGTAEDDIMAGRSGRDLFVFHHAGGEDVIRDFRSGRDQLVFVNVSPREIVWHDTEAGIVIDYGGLGGLAEDAGSILISGVHALDWQHDLLIV